MKRNYSIESATELFRFGFYIDPDGNDYRSYGDLTEEEKAAAAKGFGCKVSLLEAIDDNFLGLKEVVDEDLRSLFRQQEKKERSCQ